MRKEAVKAGELGAAERSSTFDEVVLGYGEREALEEAARCLQCKNPSCIDGCPVGIDIRKFILEISRKDYGGSYATIREKNNFPSICGRVCPAEYQCRKTCVLTKKGLSFASANAINIHFLERFAGDYGMKNSSHDAVNPVRELIGSLTVDADDGIKPPSVFSNGVKRDPKLSGHKAAIVGSGPAGIACAGELARRGVKVTVFEGLHKTGGVLQYGIPPFRLPRDILNFEMDSLKKMGVEFLVNFVIGPAKTLGELFSEGYSAVFLGLGAGIPGFLGIKGENLCNIYSANEFLTRVNLMSAYKFPKADTPVNIGRRIIVIGGGNTAMDAARAALRLQKMNGMEPDTSIYYRRTEVEMPARRLEITHAREEGVAFKFLVKPEEFTPLEKPLGSLTGFTGGADGFVKKIKCLRCELGEADNSGRRRPVEIKGSDFETDCDMVIIAVGLKANRLMTKVTPELKTDKYGDVVVDPRTMETSVKGVFAGGDIVGGEGTVIEAMGMAKKAAGSIIEYISRQ